MRSKIWIDSDGGVDDALALAYALENPEIDVRGVSTVAGNVEENRAYQNVKHILSLFGREDVQVVRGASKPIIRELVQCTEVHGNSGLGWIRPREFDYNGGNLREALAKTDAESIVCLGPLTNLALNFDAVESNSSLRNIHTMSGTMDQPNFHGGEYNLYVDPEAGREVLKSNKRIFVYGTEVCDPLLTPSLLIDNRAEAGLKRNTLDLLLQWFDMKPLYDPTAVIGSLSQDFFSRRKVRVSVSDQRGRFKVDQYGKEVNFVFYSSGVMDEFSRVLFKSKPNKRVAILSPHLDDAFLSLGGTILRYQGHFPVDVINVFTRSSYSRTPCEDVSEMRLREDSACFDDLTVRSIYIGMPDWTMRGYRQWNSQPSETKGFLSDLKKRVGGYLEEGSVLVKPMGVGGCVDHRILADVKFDVPLQLGYEDLPYADYPELGFPKGFERVHRIDVTKKIGEKLTRLREYGSQLSESDLERVRHHSEFNGRNYEKLWRQE